MTENGGNNYKRALEVMTPGLIYNGFSDVICDFKFVISLVNSIKNFQQNLLNNLLKFFKQDAKIDKQKLPLSCVAYVAVVYKLI